MAALVWMPHPRDYGHTKAKSQILCNPNSNPTPKYLGVAYEDLRTVFVSNFFVIVTVIVTVIVPYAMFILLL